MTTKWLEDSEEGASLLVVEWEGVYFSGFTQVDHLEALMNLHFRPDDILLCSYPKTGSHWLYEMTRMLVDGSVEPVKESRETVWLESSACLLQDLGARSSPRVLTTHLPYHKLPKGVRDSGCKIVVIERNIKDVAVSLYAMYSKMADQSFLKATWKGFLNLFLSGKSYSNSYFDHVKDFRKAAVEKSRNSIRIFTYEDFKQDHRGQLQQLSEFLGLHTEPQVLDDIARLTDFSSMKSYKDAGDFEKQLFSTGQNEFYRKGVVGDWKNWFTVAQSEKCDEEYQRQMGEKFKC